jgi:hypothetical protein
MKKRHDVCLGLNSSYRVLRELPKNLLACDFYVEVVFERGVELFLHNV